MLHANITIVPGNIQLSHWCSDFSTLLLLVLVPTSTKIWFHVTSTVLDDVIHCPKVKISMYL